jgi:hypothetical protein
VLQIPAWLVIAVSLLATSGVATTGRATSAPLPQDEGLRALGGTWIYVEDRTKDRPVEQQGPPMSPSITLRVEKDAVIWVRARGEERYPIDGSVNEVTKGSSVTRYKGAWKDGAFAYDTDIVRVSDDSRVALIRREFRVTPDGLRISVAMNPPNGRTSVALYRHVEDIPLPGAAKAKIADLAWLAGAWVGTRGKRSIEERWGPPLGGAMLGVSRTVSRGKMIAFEFLRVVERDGGLLYVAQPGGRQATEYVLTKLQGKRAVFDNPRHDFPQRIVYELSDAGGLTAAIGFINGGRPRLFEFDRERK